MIRIFLCLLSLAGTGFAAEPRVVILDVEDVVLRYEAIRPNCLVYAKDGFDRGDYYSRRLREYLI